MELRDLFGGAYRGRRVLVTGHTGFKGSWLALWLHELGAQVSGLALEPDTDPNHWTILAARGIADHRVDLRNPDDVHRRVAEIEPEIVFHLAAQSLVRRSYRDPRYTFQTNVLGLVNLFEALRTSSSVRVFVNATTDKVYTHSEDVAVPQHPFRESDALGGHDPYSASKACAEILTASYRKSFFAKGLASHHIAVATARAGNVIGGGDWADERLVPDFVRAATSRSTLELRNPDAVRPWQHVLEPLSGYLLLGARLLREDDGCETAFNFGPRAGDMWTVREAAHRLQTHWPVVSIQSKAPSDQPHEAGVLQLDCSRAASQLAWMPVWSTDQAVQRTADWYRAYYERQDVRSRDDLFDYTRNARSENAVWTKQ